MNSESRQPVKKWPFVVLSMISASLGWVYVHGLPVSIGIDPHTEHCLTQFHAGLLIKFHPRDIRRGELVFFKPFGALNYVKQSYVLKEVAGLPGDHLIIHNGSVEINGRVIVNGLPLSGYYDHASWSSFDKDEVIPANDYFVVGDHPRSDDSRYWGYLQNKQILGHAIAIY